MQHITPGSRLLRTWTLKGGVSAQVTGLEIITPDGDLHKLVVRQHGERDYAHNPRIARDEFRLLQILHAAGLPVPEPIHVDDTLFPRPCVVIAFIDGKPQFDPAHPLDFVRELATLLARVHRMNVSELRFLHGTGVLLHGDFWTGNVLCRDGRVQAIIDWEDARLGDPLADLANSRLETLWAFGMDAMHHFTRHYLLTMPHLDPAPLPYHDLQAASRTLHQIGGWGLDAATERRMRDQHALFVWQALVLV